jgi:hypothetical protein
VNPTAVGEAIGKDPIVLEVWGDRGAGGCAGDGEMVLTGLGFKAQSCD